MANHETDEWLDGRLAGLKPGREWNPDAGRALSRLRARSHRKPPGARRWIWTTLAAGCAYFTLLLLPASHACAEQPGPCVLRVLGVATHTADNFKEIGSATAPITLEIYIDYECEHCEAFVRDIVPQLITQYVGSGRVKLLYRDYPLPGHGHAGLAARYANAAGGLGYYDAAMRQLFATRETWSTNGDIDSQLAQVLPRPVMERLRDLVNTPVKTRDNSIAADLAAGQGDHLDRVPFVVIVSDGKRQTFTDATPSFDALKTRLDRLAAQ